MTAVERLAALLQELPADALLPVGFLRSHLTAETPESPALAPARDLTVKEFGACLGRSASTARLWCERGEVDGAWKLKGKEWRIPAESVEKFRQAQGAPVPETVKPIRGDLGDWRRHPKPAA